VPNVPSFYLEDSLVMVSLLCATLMSRFLVMILWLLVCMTLFIRVQLLLFLPSSSSAHIVIIHTHYLVEETFLLFFIEFSYTYISI
jgi:hypothetical protein